MAIVWLASYPKSGNTWFRALLTAYFEGSSDTPDINALTGAPVASSRHEFDERTGLASSELTEAQIDRLRPAFHAHLAAEGPETFFVKTHHAFRVIDGTPVFQSATASAVIYLVRHPFDVAVSFAHHTGRSVAEIISDMCADEFGLAARSDGIHTLLPERHSSWADHSTGWLDQTEIPVHLVRYEDLAEDAALTFTKALAFAGLEPDAAAVSGAVESAQFSRLQASERLQGFKEKQPGAGLFFRTGLPGEGRRQLTSAQQETLVRSCHSVMQRLDYR